MRCAAAASAVVQQQLRIADLAKELEDANTRREDAEDQCATFKRQREDAERQRDNEATLRRLERSRFSQQRTMDDRVRGEQQVIIYITA